MLPTEEAYIAQLLLPLRLQAGKDNILDTADIDRWRRQSVVSARAQELYNLFLFDLNGDGVVTKAEIEQKIAETRGMDGVAEQALKKDLNRDGRIEFGEALEWSKRSLVVTQAGSGEAANLASLLELDPDGDGRLTPDELKSAGHAAFAWFDKDGNGVLSTDESNAKNKYLSNARRTGRTEHLPVRVPAQTARDCILPPPGKNHKVLLVSAYGAGTISTVSVAGQDEVTETSSLRIEPGTSPLYVIATTLKPNIWRVSGKTDRISRFVTFPQRRRDGYAEVGVTGLPKEKVLFLPGQSCFRYFDDPASGTGRQAKALMEVALGRPVEAVIAESTLIDIALPSGRLLAKRRHDRSMGGISIRGKNGEDFFLSNEDLVRARKEGHLELKREPVKASPGIDQGTARDFQRFSPGGVVKIDAAEVVTPGKAEDYQVLPQQAGLIQLMRDGRIKRLSDGVYYVQKPIPRYPAGLHGAVRIMLAKGVPVPKGHSGQAVVISEETGQQVKVR